MRAAIAYITLAFFVTSCAGRLVAATPLAPTSLPSPTAAPTLPPTSTPEPTLEIPTAEATVDLTAPDAFVCAVRSQAIRNGTKFSSKDHFNMAWKLKNMGQATWDPGSIRFTYYSGTRMQVYDANQLLETVDPGNNTTVFVDMIAPKASGKYSTVWALWHGDDAFCTMTLHITVR